MGGLEANRLTDWDVEEMRKLRIKELWMACDTKGAVKTSIKVIRKLSQAGFSQNHIRCYCLIGDNMGENEARLMAIYEAGDYHLPNYINQSNGLNTVESGNSLPGLGADQRLRGHK